MHRNFRRHRFTVEDARTYRRWVRGVGIFYGLVGFLVVSFVIVWNYQTDPLHNAAAMAASATTLAINNNRATKQADANTVPSANMNIQQMQIDHKNNLPQQEMKEMTFVYPNP